MALTPDDQIIQLLKGFAPDVTGLLKKSGYFDLPEGIEKEQISKQIGFERGGKLYRKVAQASMKKNGAVSDIVLNEVSLKQFKAGARKVAGQIGVSYPKWDWNPAAQDYFETHGLELVRGMTVTDLNSLKSVIQNNFNLNPKTFADKYADSYSCSEGRLYRIKRTETHSATQAGGKGFAGDAGFQFKKWHCTHIGDYPRPSHREQEGMIIPIDENFPITDEDVPSEVNCRCYLTYHMTDGSSRAPTDEGEEGEE
jgi:hypothetical protein